MNKQTKNFKHWAQYTSNFLKKTKSYIIVMYMFHILI